MNRANYLIHKQYDLYSRRLGGVFLSKLLNRWIRWYYHCDIPYSLNLTGVYFAHKGFGVVINPKSSIGKGTYIQHDVTIGARDDTKNTNAPQIGENCYIGAKAIIIGDINIGNNVKIGAGAVVTKNVPDNATAVGVPARIILK